MKKLILLVFVTCIWTTSYCQWIQGGIGWEVQYIGTTSIYPCDNSHIWALGYRGFPLASYYQLQKSYARSADGGLNWTINEITVPDSFVRQLVCITNYDTAWIRLGKQDSNEDNQQLLRTQNGGLSWEQQFPQWMLDSTKTISHMHFFNNFVGLAMGYSKTDTTSYSRFAFYRTNDGGDTWNEIPQTNIPTTTYFERLQAFCTVDSTIWLSTFQNRILKSVDWGVHWEFSGSPLAFTDGDLVPLFITHTHGIIKFTGIGYSSLYETYDGGINWNSITNSEPLLNSNLKFGICIVPGTTNTFVCNGNNGSWHSFDGGHNWNEFQEFSGLSVNSIAFTDVNHGWAGTLTTLPNPGSTGVWRYDGNLVTTNETNKPDRDFLVFPNPSFGKITFCLDGSIDSQIFITITTPNGQAVYVESFTQNETPLYKNCNLKDLNPGVYLLSVSVGNKIVTKKITILLP